MTQFFPLSLRAATNNAKDIFSTNIANTFRASVPEWLSNDSEMQLLRQRFKSRLTTQSSVTPSPTPSSPTEEKLPISSSFNSSQWLSNDSRSLAERERFKLRIASKTLVDVLPPVASAVPQTTLGENVDARNSTFNHVDGTQNNVTVNINNYSDALEKKEWYHQLINAICPSSLIVNQRIIDAFSSIWHTANSHPQIEANCMTEPSPHWLNRHIRQQDIGSSDRGGHDIARSVTKFVKIHLPGIGHLAASNLRNTWTSTVNKVVSHRYRFFSGPESDICTTTADYWRVPW